MGWVFGAPRGWRRRPIGRPGQIVCPRCMPEHHRSARSFSRNWRDHHPEPSVCGRPRTQPRCWQAKAWRCRIGPDLRRLSSVRRSQSIRRWESESTVGNFTHLLLATPSMQHARLIVSSRTAFMLGVQTSRHRHHNGLSVAGVAKGRNANHSERHAACVNGPEVFVGDLDHAQ